MVYVMRLNTLSYFKRLGIFGLKRVRSISTYLALKYKWKSNISIPLFGLKFAIAYFLDLRFVYTLFLRAGRLLTRCIPLEFRQAR